MPTIGSSSDVQNQIDTQGKIAQTGISNLGAQLGQQYQNMYGNYGRAVGTNTGQNADISGAYKNLYGGASANATSGIAPALSGYGMAAGGIAPALAGYSNFAQTGGFSPQDIQDIRARAQAPTTAVYQNAQADLNRNRAIQGGTSPNFNAATAQMARNEANQMSTDNVNANASIAQMVQQGKLYGLQGLASMGMQGAGGQGTIGMGGLSNQTQNLAGQTGLYGATPGLTNTFGQQVLGTGGQQLGLTGQQNQLGLGMMNAQLGQTTVPSNLQVGLGNMGSVMGAAGNVAGGLSNLLKSPGGIQQAQASGQIQPNPSGSGFVDMNGNVYNEGGDLLDANGQVVSSFGSMGGGPIDLSQYSDFGGAASDVGDITDWANVASDFKPGSQQSSNAMNQQSQAALIKSNIAAGGQAGSKSAPQQQDSGGSNWGTYAMDAVKIAGIVAMFL